jgi:hypothetical protein
MPFWLHKVAERILSRLPEMRGWRVIPKALSSTGSHPCHLLCLFAFLAYLLLPVVFYGHLSVAFLPASQEDPRAGLLAIGTHPVKSPQPYGAGVSYTTPATAICLWPLPFLWLTTTDQCWPGVLKVHRIEVSGF